MDALGDAPDLMSVFNRVSTFAGKRVAFTISTM